MECSFSLIVNFDLFFLLVEEVVQQEECNSDGVLTYHGVLQYPINDRDETLDLVFEEGTLELLLHLLLLLSSLLSVLLRVLTS